jgi:hypothetical protein
VKKKPPTIQRINDRKSWFFENIKKIDKPLANMTKQRREKTQINKIRDDRGDIITNNNKIQRSLESTLKTYIQVVENPEKMDKLLDA